MSATTTASSGSAKRIASRNRSARSSSCAQASARTSCRRSASALEPAAVLDPLGERGGDARGVALEHHVGAVVLRRVLGVEVDRDQRRRLRLGEVLGLHAVEVGADRHDDVGAVPQPPGRLHVRRHADQARVRRREQARRAVGAHDRRRRAARRAAPPPARRRARRRPPRSAAAAPPRAARPPSRARRPRSASSVARGSGAPSGTAAPSRSVAISRYTGRNGWATASAIAAAAAGATRSGASARCVDFVTGREHRRLVGRLVQHAAVDAGTPQARGDVGRDHQHRRARRPRLADRGERVRGAGAGGRQRDAELAGRARVAVGGVRGGLLVADADQPDRRVAQRLPERQVVHAGQAEAHLDAALLEQAQDQLRAGRHAQRGRLRLASWRRTWSSLARASGLRA